MTDPKDGESFFRKVVRFVANPATDWAELNSRQDPIESEYAKSELKAMIERKRRNDFVRKREFDMLRKVRREGLSGGDLAALAGSSNLDDSEPRAPDAARADAAVKAKIDEIEQQMVGESFANGRGATPRTPSFYNAPTQPAAIGDAATEPMNLPASARPAAPVAAPPAAAVMGTGMSPLSPLPGAPMAADFSNPFAVEVNEIAHDPELDEAVIAFANADFELCEQSLSSLVGAGGSRAQHAETWLVLFDLYRAIGQQHKFEGLALDYAQQFGWSAPQWFSLPKLVAEAAAEEKPASGVARVEGAIGWVAPDVVDMDAVARLRSQTLQMPLPWVLDWSAVRSVDPEACHQLSLLFRGWATQTVDMRWLGGERLLNVLGDAAPTGVRDADPVYWLLRLDALRLANRPDQFDEVAIDYCVTYEVSPPSWEPARCSVRVSEEGGGSTVAPVSVISDVSTGFVESQMVDESGMVQMATVELSGQLVGDISKTLERLQTQLGNASIVNVACSRLIRVDFIAAGDLLNWVLARRGESRTVSFEDAHRLVALFYGAMGINEHARVKVRNV